MKKKRIVCNVSSPAHRELVMLEIYFQMNRQDIVNEAIFAVKEVLIGAKTRLYMEDIGVKEDDEANIQFIRKKIYDDYANFKANYTDIGMHLEEINKDVDALVQEHARIQELQKEVEQ